MQLVLPTAITPMVHQAKMMVTNMGDGSAAQQWRGANRGLIKAVVDVRNAIGPEIHPPPLIMPAIRPAVNSANQNARPQPQRQFPQYQQQQQQTPQYQPLTVHVPVQEMSKMRIQTEGEASFHPLSHSGALFHFFVPVVPNSTCL